MNTLDGLQRKADYWAAKLGVGPVRVVWLEDCPRPRTRITFDKATRTFTRTALHPAGGDSRTYNAHCHNLTNARGTICVAAHVSRWQSIRRVSRLMRHEVAHLVGHGNHGTREFAEAAGEKPHKQQTVFLVTEGGRVKAGGIYQEMGRAGIREVVCIRRTG